MVSVDFGTFSSTSELRVRSGRRTITRALVAATVLCLVCVVAIATTNQTDDDVVVDADSRSSLDFDREAEAFQMKAKSHQMKAQALLREYKKLESSLSNIISSKNKAGLKFKIAGGGKSIHAILADAASGSASAAAAASAASGSAAAAASGAASSGAASGAASSGAASTASSGSADSSSSSSSKLVLPRYEDDYVRGVEEGDEPVPQGEVDLADPHAQEEDAEADQGAFDSNGGGFATAGDEFLTVKDLLKKVEERAAANLNEIIDAKSKFADDTFVYSGSNELKEPLAGWLGQHMENGVVVNADGPAKPSRLSGNGFRDLFVPVGSDKASGSSSSASGSGSGSDSGASAASAGSASSAAASAASAGSAASAASGSASASGSGSA